jgi:hypothetical protein
MTPNISSPLSLSTFFSVRTAILKANNARCQKGRKLKSILNIRRQKFIDLLMQIYCNYDVFNIIQICLATAAAAA